MTMSSSGAGTLRWCAALALVAAWPAEAGAQERATVGAEEALENARDVYYPPDEQSVSACAQNEQEGRAETAEGNVIVVCRRLGPANELQTRELPRPRMDQTADGAPRAPDVFGLPPCESYMVCVKFGQVAPPVLMIDLAALPEPLAPEDAALVFRAPEEEQAAAAPRITGRRVPIPADEAEDEAPDLPPIP
jgi:hypothetical protein